MSHDTQTSGFIADPPKSSLTGTVITVSVVLLLSLALARPDIVGIVIYTVLCGLLVLGIVSRTLSAIHITLFAFLWLLLVIPVPHFHIWPLTILTPLIVYGIVVAPVPRLRRSAGWLHRGSITPEVIRPIIATVIIASLALIGWVVFTRPDMGGYLALIPELPFWAYPLAGIAFAMVNAAMEEAVFRGIIMEALDSALGAGYLSIVIQAVPFAALHYLAGFPNGIPGFIMVLIYGVMLGIVRRQSRGMLAPVITHIAADLTIFTILAVIILRY